MKIQKTLIFFILILMSVLPSVSANEQLSEKLELLKLPEGFKISIYAHVPNARGMALSPNGTLYVGTRQKGSVYAVLDQNRDFKAEKVIEIAKGLNMPVGLDWKDGDLYVSATSKILKFENIDERLDARLTPQTIYSKLPKDLAHGWKYLRFGPDGWLYVPVGAPCNICDAGDPYASIARMKPDGSDFEIYVRGVRNSVGFDWHPETEELYFTDNGRDMLGDDMPPCELNRVQEEGEHFGYPYCHGGFYQDPEFGHQRRCDEFSRPFKNLGPHVAPLGMRFYRGGMFPEEYRNQIFIAEHGSWNRSKKIGYRIMLVRIRENGTRSYESFIEGWKQGEQVWGRPVDIEEMPDGSFLISDDFAGVVYRLSYDSKTLG